MTDERRMHYAATEEGLAEALRMLGDTPHKVATALANGGYRGEPGCPHACPIARYLEDMTGHEASVSHDRVGLLVGRTVAGDLDWVWVDTPAPIDEFVTAFDCYDAWPELVKP